MESLKNIISECPMTIDSYFLYSSSICSLIAVLVMMFPIFLISSCILCNKAVEPTGIESDNIKKDKNANIKNSNTITGNVFTSTYDKDEQENSGDEEHDSEDEKKSSEEEKEKFDNKVLNIESEEHDSDDEIQNNKDEKEDSVNKNIKEQTTFSKDSQENSERKKSQFEDPSQKQDNSYNDNELGKTLELKR